MQQSEGTMTSQIVGHSGFSQKVRRIDVSPLAAHPSGYGHNPVCGHSVNSPSMSKRALSVTSYQGRAGYIAMGSGMGNRLIRALL